MRNSRLFSNKFIDNLTDILVDFDNMHNDINNHYYEKCLLNIGKSSYSENDFSDIFNLLNIDGLNPRVNNDYPSENMLCYIKEKNNVILTNMKDKSSTQNTKVNTKGEKATNICLDNEEDLFIKYLKFLQIAKSNLIAFSSLTNDDALTKQDFNQSKFNFN